MLLLQNKLIFPAMVLWTWALSLSRYCDPVCCSCCCHLVYLKARMLPDLLHFARFRSCGLISWFYEFWQITALFPFCVQGTCFVYIRNFPYQLILALGFPLLSFNIPHTPHIWRIVLFQFIVLFEIIKKKFLFFWQARHGLVGSQNRFCKCQRFHSKTTKRNLASTFSKPFFLFETFSCNFCAIEVQSSGRRM